MALYAALDLHSNNSMLAILDQKDRVVFRKRLANNLPLVLRALKPYAREIKGVVVESTYNWYWLVDGLMDSQPQLLTENRFATIRRPTTNNFSLDSLGKSLQTNRHSAASCPTFMQY